MPDKACVESWVAGALAMQRAAASMAELAAQTRPDGPPPTSADVALAGYIARSIRALPVRPGDAVRALNEVEESTRPTPEWLADQAEAARRSIDELPEALQAIYRADIRRAMGGPI